MGRMTTAQKWQIARLAVIQRRAFARYCAEGNDRLDRGER